jgi:hypothetical protein
MLQDACSVIRGGVQLKQSLVFEAIKDLTVNVTNLKKAPSISVVTS